MKNTSNKKSILIKISTLLMLTVSCKPLGNLTKTDDGFCFSAIAGPCLSSTNSTEVNNVDRTDDDNSPEGFGGGSHRGTIYSGGVLTLDTISKNELHESWTPQWNHLVAYWKMDESSWNGAVNEVVDSKGSNHGLRVGDASTTTSSKVGSHAGVFDGWGDYIEAPNLSNNITNDFTYSMWVNPTSVSSGHILSIYDGVSEINLSFSNGKFMCYTFSPGSSGSVLLSTTQASVGKWYNVGCTFDSAGLLKKIYVNGKEENSTITTVENTWPNSLINIGRLIGIGSYFNGKVDDLSIWNKALTKDEVFLIYSRQSIKYVGEMISRIIDSNKPDSTWTNLDWLTTLPFGKELPGGGGAINSESSANYSSLASNTLMSGLVGLWHLNEAPGTSGLDTVKDNSGQSNHGTPNNATFGAIGKFNKAVTFGGTDSYIDLGGSPTLKPLNQITISTWVKFNSSIVGVRFLSDWHQHVNTDRWLFYLNGNGQLGFTLTNAGESNVASVFAPIQNDEWYHLVGGYNGSFVYLYVNGVLSGTSPLTGSMNVSSIANSIRIGKQSEAGDNLDGSIDEVAIWSRALSSQEVLQLYRRGANRIKYQIRTCSSLDCNDQAALSAEGWKGPGGNYLTLFSEIYNNSSISSTTCVVPQACYSGELDLLGDVHTQSPSIRFNYFGNNGLRMNNARYFQYRVIMESDDENSACDADGIGNDHDATCMPELKSVKVGLDPL